MPQPAPAAPLQRPPVARLEGRAGGLGVPGGTHLPMRMCPVNAAWRRASMHTCRGACAQRARMGSFLQVQHTHYVLQLPPPIASNRVDRRMACGMYVLPLTQGRLHAHHITRPYPCQAQAPPLREAITSLPSCHVTRRRMTRRRAWPTSSRPYQDLAVSTSRSR